MVRLHHIHGSKIQGVSKTIIVQHKRSSTVSKEDNEEHRAQQDIQDMLKRGVTLTLSKIDIQNYNGPVHYLSHRKVLKSDFSSTPCWIGFNALATFHGQRINDNCAKGLDLMNNLIGVFLKFRKNPYVITGDTKKVYHTTKISGKDQHRRRFSWRDCKTNICPEIFIMISVLFYEQPARNIATIALCKTAEMSQEISLEGSPIFEKMDVC